MPLQDPKEFLRSHVSTAFSPGPAIPESVTFVKERAFTDGRMYALRWQDTQGKHWQFIFGLIADANRTWRVTGGAGGGGSPHERVARPYPWVNLGGSFGATGLVAGGEVSDNGLEVTTVRLRWRDGFVIEDTVESNHVLFMTDHPVSNQLLDDPTSLVAELYNSGGALVSKHEAFGGRAVVN